MRVSEHCYAVTGLGLYPPWCVNAGFVTGESTTLIADTGANALAAATICGYASTARPGNRLMAVNLEPHFDHIGGNSYLRDRGIDIHGHVGIARTEEQFAAEKREFNDAILCPVRRGLGEAEAFYQGTRLEMPNLRIDREMAFELGGCRAEVLLTPGHTPFNISVWVPSDRVLFSGDALVNGYTPNLDSGNGAESWQEWRDVLRRFRALAPVAVVPGHGAVALGEDVARLIDTIDAALQRKWGR